MLYSFFLPLFTDEKHADDTINYSFLTSHILNVVLSIYSTYT